MPKNAKWVNHCQHSNFVGTIENKDIYITGPDEVCVRYSSEEWDYSTISFDSVKSRFGIDLNNRNTEEEVRIIHNGDLEAVITFPLINKEKTIADVSVYAVKNCNIDTLHYDKEERVDQYFGNDYEEFIKMWDAP